MPDQLLSTSQAHLRPKTVTMNIKNILTFRKLTSLLIVVFVLAVIVSFVARPMSAVRPDTVFSNPVPIQITTNPLVTGSPYPSTIDVSGMVGTTTKITVTLTNLTHSRTNDLDVLLVSPAGSKYIVMADAIGVAVNNVTLTFDTVGNSVLPSFSPVVSGTYRATNFLGDTIDTFPAPAPPAPYNSPAPEGTATFASVFNNVGPNGTWSLFVVDDGSSQAGTIAGGWTINVTTSGSAATNFSNTTPILIDDTLQPAAPGTPYPSIINVTGMSGVLSKLKVTISNISHARTRDMDVVLFTPNGTALALISDNGNAGASNITLVFDDEAQFNMPLGSQGPLSPGTFKPTVNNGVEFLPPPAPPPPYLISSLSSLYGFSPNGQWKLFVVDDAGGESGQIAGGWSLDITTIPYVPPTISCLSPVFSVPTELEVGSVSDPTGLASGDFNNDTKQDLVVANQTSSNIAVMLGDGSGGFASPTFSSAGVNPYAVAVGHFNADTNLDVVVANSGSNNVSLLLGTGTGGFSPAVNFVTGANPISLAVGDFNNDTKPDVIVANFGGFFAGTVSLLLGNGTGGFSPRVNFGVQTQPSFVVTGNFNADSNLDIAVANFGSNNLSILLGDGTGSFNSQPLVATNSGPVAIAVSDFNSDAKSDLVIANYNSGNIQYFAGTGTGSFQTPNNITSGPNPISIAVADFSGDGKSDLAIVYRGSDSVRMLFGTGTGSFGQGSGARTFEVGSAPNAVIAPDLNDDGKPDFATANSFSDDVSVLINSCAIAVGNRFDFEADRKTDFTVYRPAAIGIWYIEFSNGATPQDRIFGQTGDTIVPADYNGDGVCEVGIYRSSIGTWIIPNYGTSSNYSSNLYYLQFGIASDIPIPADFDGDGRADLAVYRPSDGVWYLRRSADNSEFAVPFGTSEDKPVPADYDGDGKADIAVYRPSVGSWYILQSSDGMLRSEQFGISADRPVQADYDGDGEADLAVFRPADGAWYISQSSNGAFVSYAWGVATDVPVPGDYDGDGKFDVAVWRPSTGFWYVLLSLSGSVQSEFWGTSGDVPGPSAYVQ